MSSLATGQTAETAKLAEERFAEAVVHLKRENFSEAISCFEKCIAIKPDLAEGYNNLGLALHKIDHHESALLQLKKALALKPDFAEAHNNLGNVLRDRSCFQDALHHYLQPDQ